MIGRRRFLRQAGGVIATLAATCLFGCASRGFMTAADTAGSAPRLSTVTRGGQDATPTQYHPTSWFPLAPERAMPRTPAPQKEPEVLPTPPPVMMPSTTDPPAMPSPPVTEGRHDAVATSAADCGEVPREAPPIEFDPE